MASRLYAGLDESKALEKSRQVMQSVRETMMSWINERRTQRRPGTSIQYTTKAFAVIAGLRANG